MIPIQGKYNTAKVFTDNIENTTISQIIEICNTETFKDSKIAIMPDCHAGANCVIGTTMTIKDKVVPNLVGGDIGCGIAAINMGMHLNEFTLLDEIIRKYIPYGFNTHERSREKLLREVFKIDIDKLKCKKGLKADVAYYALGTLGGGNHFIEVNEDNKGRHFLTVHTGSRHLGTIVAKHYQQLAYLNCKYKFGKEFNQNIIDDLIAKGKQHLINETINEQKHIAKELRPPKELSFVDGELLDNYLHDMKIVQEYSAANRVVILADILYNFTECKENYMNFCKKIKEQVTECIHNYIDLNNMILRKGAISALDGEPVIIPINMRDGIILGKGKGNPDWNYSAPHGAGRILSRSMAKELLDLDEYKESMKGIFTTCVGQSTLDEAPQAYKPIEEIIENIQDTVNIIDILKPVYNFKSN